MGRLEDMRTAGQEPGPIFYLINYPESGQVPDRTSTNRVIVTLRRAAQSCKACANGRVDAWPLAKPVLGAAAERLADTVLVVVGRAASRAPPDRLPIVAFAA